MATYQIELNTETKDLLQNLIHQTGLSVTELVTQGLLVLGDNVGSTVQKSEAHFFDLYGQLDMGKNNNCAYSANR